MSTEPAAGAALSWDVVSDVQQLFAYHFMVNALLAGTIVAVMAGLIGWFVLVRRQTFAGHTLSIVAFPGATGATLVGLPALAGYFAFCTASAVILALLGGAGARARSQESAATGTLQAFALGCGFLFVTLYGGVLQDVSSLLFGTFLGITDGQLVVLLGVGAATAVALGVLARPLLFASVDPDVARARSVPVGGLAVGFLLLLGLAVAATAQITGALLVFALLVTPAGTAQALTSRPGLGLALSVGIGLIVTWLGLGIAFFSPYPVGFWVTSLSFGSFVAVRVGKALLARRAARRPTPLEPRD
jgi:zinc/manganese transport system permease protein